MLIELEQARLLLADLTQGALVTVEPQVLHAYGFASCGSVLVGELAVKGVKRKNRWHVEDAEVTRAGRALASLVIDPKDRAPVGFTWDSKATDWWSGCEGGWRSQVRDLLCLMILSRPGPLDAQSLFEPGVPKKTVTRITGLLAQSADVAARRAEKGSTPVSDRTVGGTRPMDFLSLIEGRWTLPRAYADLMDRQEATRAVLLAQSRCCSRCGAQDERNSRHSSTSGWFTICPGCAASAFHPYAGELDGTRYTSALRRRLPANTFMCCVCSSAPATAWDHCHDHHLVRGPLCAPCNTLEGVSLYGSWIDTAAGVEHLLRCRGCREAQTLPPRYHAELVRRHLESVERHRNPSGPGACQTRPWARSSSPPASDGSVTFTLTCRSLSSRTRSTHPHQWEVTVRLEDFAHLVPEFLDRISRITPGADPRPDSSPPE